MRFLVGGELQPLWLDGEHTNVGALGAVDRRAGDGSEAELRLDAAMLFRGEYDSTPPGTSPKRKRRPHVGDGVTVEDRRLLADMDGQVRVEVTLRAPDPGARPLDSILDGLLTIPVYVVRVRHTEMITAGFDLARTYLEQSRKTSGQPSQAVAARLLREGAGSPFLVVARDGAPSGASEGLALPDHPPEFQAVTCRLMELAGRPTGVWQLWLGDASGTAWKDPARILRRIICQFSELTTLLRLKEDPDALTPYLLDPDSTERFWQVKASKLRRPRQGAWCVRSVQSVANEHLKVSVQDVSHTREKLEQMMSRSVAGDLASTIRSIEEGRVELPMEPRSPDQADKDRLVTLLARQALTQERYFRRLVQQADLPVPFKMQRQEGWSGQLDADARNLVEWALGKGVNPADPKNATLASLLVPELPNLGLDETATVVAFLAKYRLVRDAEALKALRIRYGVPFYDPASAQAAMPDAGTGPDFAWHGPNDARELQAWLRPEPPDFLDLGYLVGAIREARAVCRVEVGATGATGTGVRVGDRFVLTNHHVLVPERSGLPPAGTAAGVTLRFGAFGGAEATATFTLDPADPVPVWSDVDRLDFALLRVAPGIDAAPLGVATIRPDSPALRSSLSILQHPETKDMQLAPSADAVTFTDAGKGIVQYVTRTGRGSSGAPCFGEDWRVVALHHAERARTFGTIREGILMGPILREVRAALGDGILKTA